MSNRMTALLNSCRKYMQQTVAQPCLLCGSRSHAGLLCQACADELPRMPTECCPVCAEPTPGGLVCGACLKHPPAFDRTLAIYRYAFPLDVLIQRLKYADQTIIAAWLADRFFQTLSPADRPDLIVPMPLHPRRLSERGYNQAALLGKHLADKLSVRFDPHTCQRVRDTPPQVELPYKARRKNIRGAFECAVDLTGRRVALVDDVMTTGASLNELAGVLKRAGAVEVHAWTVARAVKS